MMLRQTLLYLPAQLLGPLAMFVAAVVWTHLLDAETYGVVSYVLAAQELVYMATIAWWSLFALRFRAAMDADRRRRLAEADNAVVLGGAILQTIGAVPVLMTLDTTPTGAFFLASAVLFTTRSLLTHYSEIARTEAAILTYTIAQLAGPLFGTLASFVGVITFGASPTAAIAGIAAVQTLGLALVMIRLGVKPKVVLPRRDLIGEALLYGMPMLATGMLAWVATNVIRLIVDHMAGAAALGLLSVGWGLGQRVSTVAAMLLTAAAFPIAVRLYESGDENGAMKQLSDNGSMLFALLAPTTAGVAMVSEPLVDLMIAEPFRAATVAILPLAVLAASIRNQRVHHVDQVFLLHAAPARLLPLFAIEALGCIAGSILGLTWGGTGVSGLVAAVLGCVVGTLVAAMVTLGVAMREYRLRPQWSRWARILAATGTMCAVLAAIPWGDGWLALAGEIVVGVIVYGGALAVLFSSERSFLITKLRRRTG
ncbi:MAG: oligosaccharide flippase family protein [Siculibacillus sp.]|nr:oligosaccharide flippase family protein [Siculibacillus sp.]